jgi:hypothetical protein
MRQSCIAEYVQFCCNSSEEVFINEKTINYCCPSGNFNQGSRSPGRDLNPEPPEYEAVVLSSRPRSSVIQCVNKVPMQ